MQKSEMNAVRIIETIDFDKNWKWIFIGIGLVLIAAGGILLLANAEWLYLGILLFPLILVFSIKKPFIFPFGAYLFLIPFDSILSVTGSAKGATLTKFLGVMTIFVFLLKGFFEKKLKRPNNAGIWWLLFVIFALSSILWAIEPDRVLSNFSTLTGLLLLYFITSSYKISSNEFNTSKWCILLGGFAAAVYAIYNYDRSVYLYSTLRATLSLGERSTDPNFFAFSLLIPVSICVEKIIDERKKILKALFSVILSIMIFGIVITGSRGGMLGVAVVFITYVLFMKKKITVWTILIIVAITIMSFTPPYFVERWEQAIESGGSGRIDIWDVGVGAAKDFWFMGVGLSNFPNAFSAYGRFTPFTKDIYKNPHNIYLETFVELGIMGFFLLIMAMKKHYQVIKSRFGSHYTNQIMLKATFWAILVSSFFLGTTYLKSFWLLWMMILMYRNFMEEERHKQVILSALYPDLYSFNKQKND